MSIASAIRWLIKARVCKKKQQTESKSLAFEKVRELIDSHIARVVPPTQNPNFQQIKWVCVFQWASLYCPMRNLDQMTIGKTHPTVTVDSTLLKEHIEANSLTRQKIRDNRIRLNEYTSGGDLLDQLRLVFHWPFISAF